MTIRERIGMWAILLAMIGIIAGVVYLNGIQGGIQGSTDHITMDNPQIISDTTTNMWTDTMDVYKVHRVDNNVIDTKEKAVERGVLWLR